MLLKRFWLRHITLEILKVYFVNFLQLQMSLLCLFRRKKAKKVLLLYNYWRCQKRSWMTKKDKVTFLIMFSKLFSHVCRVLKFYPLFRFSSTLPSTITMFWKTLKNSRAKRVWFSHFEQYVINAHWGKTQLFIPKFLRIRCLKNVNCVKIGFHKCEFCEQWYFGNVNFVKNNILKTWILFKNNTFEKCEFCENWDFQNVIFDSIVDFCPNVKASMRPFWIVFNHRIDICLLSVWFCILLILFEQGCKYS